MLLDKAQRCAVRQDVSTLVQASPGSGKTRTLVAKALREARKIRGTSHRIACITMSRAASEVMRSRIGSFATPDDEERLAIGTIHAFCLQEVFSPFHRVLPEYRDGWALCVAGETRYAGFAKEIYGRDDQPTVDKIAGIRRGVDGAPSNVDGKDSRRAREFWKLIESAGFIDFPSLLFRSYAIGDSQPNVRQYLRSRFKWVLVDEYQDSTDMQLAVIERLFGRDVKYFLVGDKNQSINAFAGATDVAQQEFVSKVSVVAKLKLNKNYRSSQEICDVGNCILGSEMLSAGGAEGWTPTVRHCAKNDFNGLAALLERFFLPALESVHVEASSSCIIAPFKVMVPDIVRALRANGIAARIPEPLLERQYVPRILRGIIEYHIDPSQASVDFVLNAIEQLLEFGKPVGWVVDPYRTRALAFNLLGLVSKLERLTLRGALILIATEVTAAAKAQKLVSRSWEEARMEVDRYLDSRVRAADEPVDRSTYRLHLSAMTVSWIFSSKGFEYDAVAFVELNAGIIPHHNGTTVDGLRNMFVGVTRAARVLQLYSDRREMSPFIRTLLAADVIAGVK